jgi:hypothetical protein
MEEKKNKSQKINTGVGPMFDSFLENILARINLESKFRQYILEPIAENVQSRLKPHAYLSLGLYLVLVILLMIILIILIIIIRKISYK